MKLRCQQSMLICHMFGFFVLAAAIVPKGFSQGKTTRELYSPREDPAVDVPRSPEKYSWIISDEINGIKVSTNGAPVVRFNNGEPVTVAAVATGTQVELSRFKTFKSHNYWPVTYADAEGKEQAGWVSGLFVKRQ